MLRPEGGGSYQVLFRFRSHAEHLSWMDSAVRHRLGSQIDDLLDDGTQALRPLTGDWPLPVGMLLTMGLTIPLMTWFVMPALTTRLGPVTTPVSGPTG